MVWQRDKTCIIKKWYYKKISHIFFLGAEGCIEQDSATMVMLYHHHELDFIVDLYNEGHQWAFYETVTIFVFLIQEHLLWICLNP